ncbi:MAG: DUF1499 domain-containing protein [Methylococcaceae bacterium]|jgi:uncharacterized protein (DUF1499 family)
MQEPTLDACPGSPNCVSSKAHDTEHRVSPMPVDLEPQAAFDLIKRVMATEPRLKIVEERADQGYLRAEVTSAVFRFVDDLELLLDPAHQRLEVRSASRVGYWDLGVNRRRVEQLRVKFQQAGLWR